MEELLLAVEKEKNARFSKPWPKLDKGCKMNRLNIFISEDQEKNELSEGEAKSLKKLLLHLCDNGSLNKLGDVDYSDENHRIISIKNLKYDESSKKYSFNLPKKTVKTASKSKSNIDRHFSRSKDINSAVKTEVSSDKSEVVIK